VELKVIDEELRRIHLSDPVLDLGCAEGNIAEALFKDKLLIGLDNCWELLSLNKKTDVYKALILADGCRMPYKGNVFGSVFSNCVIEHIPDVDGLLNEVSRVLKKGGVFLFTVPSHTFGDWLFFSSLFNALGLKKLGDWYKVKRNRMLNHFHCLDISHWESLLNENQMDLIRYRYYLDKKTTGIWDFLAAAVFLLKKIKLSAAIGLFRKIVNAEYNRANTADCRLGSALLIFARKKE
jgi:SAM-dependent methyltransferase